MIRVIEINQRLTVVPLIQILTQNRLFSGGFAVCVTFVTQVIS